MALREGGVAIAIESKPMRWVPEKCRLHSHWCGIGPGVRGPSYLLIRKRPAVGGQVLLQI